MQAQIMEALSTLKAKRVCGVPALVVAVIVLVCASLSFGLAAVAKKNGGVAAMLSALKASKGNPMKVLEGNTERKARPPSSAGAPTMPPENYIPSLSPKPSAAGGSHDSGEEKGGGFEGGEDRDGDDTLFAGLSI